MFTVRYLAGAPGDNEIFDPEEYFFETTFTNLMDVIEFVESGVVTAGVPGLCADGLEIRDEHGDVVAEETSPSTWEIHVEDYPINRIQYGRA